MEQKLNLSIETSGNEVIIRHGEALPQRERKAIVLKGEIDSVSKYIESRSIDTDFFPNFQNVRKEKAIILFSKSEKCIRLKVDPSDELGTDIGGQLQDNPDLVQFSINGQKTFSREEFVKLLKFNRLFFDDADKHAELVTAFQKVSSSVNINANDSSDTRGNKERGYIKEVKTNAPTEFILNIPIFKGFEPERFRVEVCLDVTDGSVRFWLESVELHELIQKRVDEIFEAEAGKMEGYLIINV